MIDFNPASQAIHFVEFHWFYKRNGRNAALAGFAKFDRFYKRNQRYDTRQGNHTRQHISIGFISEIDEIAAHSGNFTISLISLCFTSEMEGLTDPAIR